jgi:mono/diheme cytochrome c family protein
MENIPRHKAEMDWNDLFKKPAKLFGYSYIYFIIVISAVGYLYISNLTTIGKNSVVPSSLKDSSAFIQDIPMQSPKVIQPIDVIKAGISTQELVTRGKELFKANCSSCHGDDGQGDGPTASTLTPKPRNFHSLNGWKNGSKVTRMYKTIQEGIVGSAMASYSYMPPEDCFALIHFIRTLADGHPLDSQIELQQLDSTYQLSKGMNVAGQIPIRKAMQKIVQENAPSVKHAEQLASIINSDRRYSLLKSVTIDKAKLVWTMMRYQYVLSSEETFIKFISIDPLYVGLNVKVLRISDKEWKDLYDEVNLLMKEGL